MGKTRERLPGSMKQIFWECKINCVKIIPEISDNDEPERSSWVKMFGLDAQTFLETPV